MRLREAVIRERRIFDLGAWARGRGRGRGGPCMHARAGTGDGYPPGGGVCGRALGRAGGRAGASSRFRDEARASSRSRHIDIAARPSPASSSSPPKTRSGGTSPPLPNDAACSLRSIHSSIVGQSIDAAKARGGMKKHAKTRTKRRHEKTKTHGSRSERIREVRVRADFSSTIMRVEGC